MAYDDIFGLGNCSDDKSGTTRLFGPNLPAINSMMRDPYECIECVGGKVTPEFFVCLDVAALRHTEHIANSGWCSCSQAPAMLPATFLRSVTLDPATFAICDT